jgi:hypothetical protein
MKCWHCNEELRWCCDYDIAEDSEGYAVETLLFCDNCESETLVYLPKEKEKDVDSKPTISTTQ